MAIRNEWLNEDEAVYSIKVVEQAIAYVRYISEHYPDIDAECKNYINESLNEGSDKNES